MKRYKIIEFRQTEVYAHILEAVKIMVGMVGVTLGHCGRRVLTDKRGTPRLTDDGVSIAINMVVKDELTDKAVQAIRESAQKTSEMVGDGTTTSTILACAIVADGIDKILINGNQMALREQIKKECAMVIEELKKIAKPVKTKEELAQVAFIATENRELSDIIGEMVETVGVDGFIDVEEGFSGKTEWQMTQGMHKDGSYAAPDFVTNAETREAIFEDTPILLVEGKFERFEDLTYVLQVRTNTLNKDKMVIIANSFSPEMIKEIRRVVIKFAIPILPISAPSLTSEQLEDIAIYTGGKVFDQRTPESVVFEKASRKSDYGFVKKIVVDRKKFLLIGGEGDQELINKRIETLKKQIELEMALPLKNQIKNRIGSMASGVGELKVGAPTDVERNYLFRKAQNGVHSAQAALAEGVVSGGGLALKQISEKLELTALKEALKAPYKKIALNATGNSEVELEITDDIIDPIKVVRIALENACSLAGELLAAGAIESFKEHDLESELQEIMDDYALRAAGRPREFGEERMGMP